MIIFKIDIIFDIVCFWCVIGYVCLKQVVVELKDEFEVEVEWYVFELNLDLIGDGELILLVLVCKYGCSEDEMWVNQVQMMEIVVDFGLNFEKLQECYICNIFDGY